MDWWPFVLIIVWIFHACDLWIKRRMKVNMIGLTFIQPDGERFFGEGGGGVAANFWKVTADGVMEMMVRYGRDDKGGGREQARKVVSSTACQHASICELQGWKRQTRFKTLLPLSQPPRCFRMEKKNHTLCGRSRDSLKWNSENRTAMWVCALSLFYYVFITVSILCYLPSILKRAQ